MWRMRRDGTRAYVVAVVVNYVRDGKQRGELAKGVRTIVTPELLPGDHGLVFLHRCDEHRRLVGRVFYVGKLWRRDERHGGLRGVDAEMPKKRVRIMRRSS